MAALKFRNGKTICDYGKPYIIAELGSNHNGDMELAKKLIEEAKKCGCDCVKFQSWSKDTIFSKKVYKDNFFLNDDYRNRTDYTLEEIVNKFSIGEDELYEMSLFCEKLGIDFSSSPFSEREVDFLADDCKAPFIKVASMDLNNYPFLRYIARKNIPIVLATGLSSISEVARAIETIEAEGNRQICLLHCISIYPPEFEDINLNNIIMLRTMYQDYPIGFSDHSIGTEIPSAAVALGACIVEKHFTLNKDMFGWDHKISADPQEMKQLVDSCRHVQKALGSMKRIINEEEMSKREAFRRSIVSTRNLKKGTKLSYQDLTLKRPGTGLPPEKLDDIIGRRINRNIECDEIIEGRDLT